MKIRIEVSSSASKFRSGVAQYTRLLTEAFSNTATVDTHAHYFNFLDRQPHPTFTPAPQHIEENRLIPLRVYAKTQSHSIAPPFDAFLPKVDLTIFPNFATWPSLKTNYTATVIHDLTYLYFPEVVEDKNLSHLKRVVPRSIKRADFIITVSESVKNEIIKEFSIQPERCIVTPIPPDSSFFTKQSSSIIKLAKKKYAINPDKKYIYFIGNLEPRKNLKTLIEAYQLLPDSIKNEYSLVLAGGHGWKSENTQLAIDKAVKNGEQIQHIGFVDQVDSPALLQGASLFVMPSLYEGFGMPILEAMAGGTQVVASDIPVLREVGKECALYAKPSSPRSFARVIEKALSSPQFDKNTLRHNVLRYSWQNNVDLIIKTVNKLHK